MKLTTHDIARMMDASAVRAESDETEVRALADCVRKYQCIAAFTLPGFTPLIHDLLADAPDIRIGGVVAFPSGGHATSIKTAEAHELARAGCDELDMVINVGMLRSGKWQYVEDDIRSVAEASDGAPVKVILECHHLSDDEIRKGCELCVKAGAAFVKTGTGWAPTGATVENIALMKSCVGDAIGVKAAGGIRNLDTLLELYRQGARRFGVGLKSIGEILEDCAARGGAVTL